MATVGQINDKISELRSKIAITEGLVLHLKANYISSDSGDAEMHFTRADGGHVPQGHIQSTIADYVEYIDNLRAELHQWENLTVTVPEPAKMGAAAPEAPEPPAAKPPPAAKKPVVASAQKETLSGTARGHQDQPAPGQAAGGKAG